MRVKTSTNEAELHTHKCTRMQLETQTLRRKTERQKPGHWEGYKEIDLSGLDSETFGKVTPLCDVLAPFSSFPSLW